MDLKYANKYGACHLKKERIGRRTDLLRLMV